MGVIGFNFTKVSAERNPAVSGQVNISNNLAIKDVQKEEMSIAGDGQLGLRVAFEFSSKYKPDMGNIVINANVLALESKEEGDKILKEWEKNKKLPDSFMRQTLSFMLRRCNIKALVLAEDLNLPSPVPLPKLDPGKASNDEE